MATVGSIPARARVRARLRHLPRTRQVSRPGGYPRLHAAVVFAGDVMVAAAAWTAGWAVMPAAERATAIPFLTVVALAWPTLLAVRGAYEARALNELNRVGRCIVELIALFAVASVVFEPSIPRARSVATVAVLFAGSLTVRRLVGYQMRSMRREGLALRRTIAVGTGSDITTLVDQLAAGTEHEFVVVGAYAEGPENVVEDVPVLGRLPMASSEGDALDDNAAVERVLIAAAEMRADMVCVTGSSQFTGARLRALSWALAERHIDLVAAPGLIEIAPHRIEYGQAGAAALLHVHPVRVAGARALVKHVSDRVLAALALAVLLPVLVGIGVAVRATSPGPALYRQTRVGVRGRHFTMLKFRSMHLGADSELDALAGVNEHDGHMFKLRQDPRITGLGRILRRLSLDELPQLVNVLRGEMSLVGPRPPLPEEVAAYNPTERRRLLVRPGMTGLWQVSGRSNLSWEETLRLDLRYVDNWSLGLDASLLWRTGRVVVRGTGAY